MSARFVRMNRSLSALLVLCALATGCKKESRSSEPAPTVDPDPVETPAADQDLSRQLLAGTKARVFAALPLEDEAARNEIFGLLQHGVYRYLKVFHGEDTDIETWMRTNFGFESSSPPQSPSDFRESRDAALDKLKAKAPSLSDYEAKRVIVSALKAGWSKGIVTDGYKFRPEKTLRPVADPPAVPPAVDEFMQLRDATSFWREARYQELERASANALPTGAIVPLFHLMNMPLSTYVVREEITARPVQIIERYGPRACGAAIDFLTSPDRYGYRGSEPPLRYLELASSCPSEVKREVFRSALMSGWLGASHYLHTDSAWEDEVSAEFKDSPYRR